MTISVVQEAVAPKHYFSQAGGLTINFRPGHYDVVDGKKVFIGDRHIAFTPIGNVEAYGHYVTSDPEEIAFLESRIVNQGDVFDATEYNKRVIPPEVQLQDAQRVIDSQNKLLEQLKVQLAERERQEREAANPNKPIKPPVAQPVTADAK